MTVGGAIAVLQTGQEGQGREKEKSGSEDLEMIMHNNMRRMISSCCNFRT